MWLDEIIDNDHVVFIGPPSMVIGWFAHFGYSESTKVRMTEDQRTVYAHEYIEIKSAEVSK